MVRTSPVVVVASGVKALPKPSNNKPTSRTRAGPYRSATAPAMGCTAPQVNCAMAMAKLMEAMPTPVEILIGATNKPSDWRAPIVTSKTPTAVRTIHSQCVGFCGVMSSRFARHRNIERRGCLEPVHLRKGVMRRFFAQAFDIGAFPDAKK